jgi:hypothetical protein
MESVTVPSFDRDALADFYAKISAGEGVSVAGFQQELDELFGRYRSPADLNDYRLSRGLWKKLADEVAPLSRLLRLRGIDSGRVRLPLDDHPPDCWLWETAGADPVGIEVTIALGRERYYLKSKMVREGIGRGFLGVREDARQADFSLALARPRAMYTPAHALAAVEQGICRRLAQKNYPKFAGFILLIEAPYIAARGPLAGDPARTRGCGRAASIPGSARDG